MSIDYKAIRDSCYVYEEDCPAKSPAQIRANAPASFSVLVDDYSITEQPGGTGTGTGTGSVSLKRISEEGEQSARALESEQRLPMVQHMYHDASDMQVSARDYECLPSAPAESAEELYGGSMHSSETEAQHPSVASRNSYSTQFTLASHKKHASADSGSKKGTLEAPAGSRHASGGNRPVSVLSTSSSSAVTSSKTASKQEALDAQLNNGRTDRIKYVAQLKKANASTKRPAPLATGPPTTPQARRRSADTPCSLTASLDQDSNYLTDLRAAAAGSLAGFSSSAPRTIVITDDGNNESEAVSSPTTADARLRLGTSDPRKLESQTSALHMGAGLY